MPNVTKTLQGKFLEKNRYSNFGPCLRMVHVHGFRGIAQLDLKIDFPITAISGLNGAGKSTLGQLAICAYKKPSTAVNYKRQYIKDFFPISPADPKPISDDAKVVFSYETDDYRKPQEVTVARASSAWAGYKRQPERHCYYVGFTVYIPKVEHRDLSVYGGKTLQFTEKRRIDPDVIEKVARIVGHRYEEISFQGVSHREKESEIGIATRLGHSYSENNMGFGEGRVLYTVDKLETSPEQSLFILEEPETSMHECAQHEFAKYLLDVCDRRHHQIILSTHSSVIVNALPPESRKMVTRDRNGVEISNGISANQLKSVLSGGHVRSLDICVEDQFARVLLIEILRRFRKELLKSVAIHDIGSRDAVREAVKVLKKTGKRAIGVRDGDTGQSEGDGLFSFPGGGSPESVVFSNPSVKDVLRDKYGVDVQWLLQRDGVQDHHQITACLAREAETDESVMRTNAIEAYVNAIGTEFDPLVKSIYDAANA